MSKSPYSLLPDNRSSLERGLEEAFSDLLYEVPSPYPILLDAMKTPAHMLPYLAQERSVPEWNSEDPEHIKRQMVDKAWEVRRLSGTRAGIKLVLQTLDYDSQVTPWFKMDEQAVPYTLEVLAWEKGNKPVDVDKAKRLIAHLNETKSCRDTIELGLVFGVETQLGMSGASAPPTNVKETDGKAELWPMPEANVSLAVVGAIPNAINVVPLSLVATVVPYQVLGESAVTGGGYSLSVSPITARAIT
ncbi:MAG: phage tail protein I [Ketobacter sp.]|nr:phage tail protein I [Ketobacter sp.]